MERTILVILLIVGIVGVVGVFSAYDFGSADAIAHNGVTGNVVANNGLRTVVEPYDCASCTGYSPVCARLNHWYTTYPNACAATCAGGTIVRQYACEKIPTQ